VAGAREELLNLGEQRLPVEPGKGARAGHLDTHRPAVEVAEQGGALAADCVHDRSNVVHSCFEVTDEPPDEDEI
jgi:hypothetical protein